MNEEKKTIESFKRYIIFQESTLDDYYKMDEEYYKDKIEQLELSIKLLKTVLNLLEKKDKMIYEIAKSNVKLKGYDVEETYINNTISFYTKYIENLERNPHRREESRK